MRKLSKLYILVFLLNAILINAQNEPYNFPSDINVSQLMISHWTVEEGLPSQGLRNFIQAKNGYIWITSYDGLIRFDGFDFKIFNSKNTSVFKENTCSDIVEDKNNTLWFLSRYKLLYYKNNSFKELPLNQEFDKIRGPLFVDRQNRLWVVSNKHGIFFIKNEKPVFFNDTLIENLSIRSITEDNLGNIYFETLQNKIVKYNNEKFSVIIQQQNNISIYGLLHFFNDKLFWVKDGNSVHYFDEKTVKKNSLFKNEPYYSFAFDKDGNRLFSTKSGLYIQNKITGKIEYILKNDNNFSSNIIQKTLVDSEGNIWLLMTRNGLIKLRYGKFASINSLSGLNGKIVNTIFEKEDGSVSVGFNNGSIDHIKDEHITNFLHPDKTKKARIRNQFEDSQGNMWISTYRGLLKIYPSGKKYWFDINSGFPEEQIRFAFEDSKKNIWIGTRREGIIKINENNTFQTFPELEKLKNQSILSMIETPKGKFMIGTAGKGLFIVSQNKIIDIYTMENHLNNNVIFDIHIDTEGIIWIVTNGGGINRLEGDASTYYTMNNGLANDSPFDIIEDNSGNFWMPFTNGVMKVNKKQLNDFAQNKTKSYDCEVFDKYDGIKSLGFTPAGHSLKAKDGKIWFPSLNGIEVINPTNISYNNLPPTVHIEEFKLDGESVDLNSQIIIEPNIQRFNFKYTAICLQAPEKVRFKYKLEGFDENWIEVNSETRLASYTNLKHGAYTFKVIACNNDGVWNKKGTKVSFVVKPYFYNTAWFSLISIILFLAIIFLLYKLRIRQIKKSEAKLKEIVTKRTAQISLQKHELEAQHDEITTINENLLQQKTELEKHKNHLEEIVNERTSELVKAKIQAEESDKLKTAFLNNMSHEIRTPMNGILGFIQLVADYDLDNKQRDKYIEVITSSTNQLLSIVDEIIYISKIEAGVEKLKKNEVSLNSLFTNIYDYFLPIAKKKSIEIVWYNKAESKPISINSDFAKLNQILTIIIDNAFKFTQQGKIEFGYKQIEGFMQFHVSDTGIGIAAEMHQKIFQQFRQVDDTNTKKHGGLGLGLSISKAYVKLLGGKIWLESEINKGTTFFFTIPYVPTE